MNNHKKFSTLLGVCALTALSFALAGSPLRYKPKVGDVQKYNVSIDLTINGEKVHMSGTTTHKVLKVAANGNVTIESKDSQPTVMVNGSTVDIPDTDTGAPETSVVRPDLTTVSVGGNNVTPDRFRSETVQTVQLPNFPLAVGKSWTWICPADAKTGAVKTRGYFKILASEKVKGVDTWKVSSTVKELTGAKPASATGTQWLNKKDATPVKVDLREKNVPMPGAPGPLDALVHVELIP